MNRLRKCGVGGRGVRKGVVEEGRNDPNIVCTYE
jgi:hypothetical protein